MKLTILMYHKIAEPAPNVRYPGNYVSPANFERQMDALLSWGYASIRFEEWFDYRAGQISTLPAKPLIVTFDDGYTCFDRHAWPILRARRIGATMFLVAGQIGGTNAWDREETPERLLDATRIRELLADGVDFGSHTVSHPALTRIPPARAFDELVRSRASLGELLGRNVDVLAYPFSNQDLTVRRLARQAGYRGAVRGRGRMNRRSIDPFGLRRIKVERATTVAGLRKTLFIERWMRV